MLGDFITRGLVLVLGYAYPAFECFKTVEKNRVEIEELLFWCQYWIIVAVLTVFERIGEIFISWLPMYGEMKLAFFIYLWYPKTKGTGYVYETFLRPYVAKHETDIDRSLQELKARAWDLAVYYWQNFAQIGQATFFQILQYLASQSAKMKNTSSVSEKIENNQSIATPTPSSLMVETPSPRTPNKHKPPSIRRRPPIPPPSSSTVNCAIVQSPKSNAVQVHLHSQTEFIHIDDESTPESVSGPGSTDESDTGLDRSLQAASLRLSRSKGFH